MTQTIHTKVVVLLCVIAGSMAVRSFAAPPVATASGSAIIDGRRYPFSGAAECTHTAAGSIHGAPAAIWHASVAATGGALSHVNATIFQTKIGAPQATMYLTVGQRSFEISNVGGGVPRGTAVAKAERNGTGGTLAIEGRTVAGESIVLTVSCRVFAAPEDNG